MKCLIQDCTNQSFSRKMCRKHYMRWWVHGDPTYAKFIPAKRGAPMAFIEALPAVGSGCILWPYSKNNAGYGQVSTGDGGKVLATRLVCERHHGKPPSPQHHAAHSCGCGHTGCISPWHLSWKSPAENTADSIYTHKTFAVGERHPNAKLSVAKVRKIISLKGKVFQSEIARRFSISQTIISRIHRGKAWKHSLAPQEAQKR